jgi:hypothetical protein
MKEAKVGEGMPNQERKETEKSFEGEEFIRYCEANSLDYNEEDMDEDDRKGFRAIKKWFMKAVKEKRLVVDGVKLLYTISEYSKDSAGKEIAIRRPIGRDFMAMDGLRETQSVQKLNGFIASMCDQEKSFVARLDILDRQFLEGVGTLFLTA